MNNLREIQTKISEKLEKIDKNGKDYLILRLDNGEDIFVFDNHKLPRDKWNDLKEGSEYTFTVKESNFGSNILVEYNQNETVFV